MQNRAAGSQAGGLPLPLKQGFAGRAVRVGWPQPLLPRCLSACLAELPPHAGAAAATTPSAACESVPACPGIPTGGENSPPRCYALIACQVPLPVCSLVILPPLFPLFLTLSLAQLLAADPAFMSRFPLRLLYFCSSNCLCTELFARSR